MEMGGEGKDLVFYFVVFQIDSHPLATSPLFLIFFPAHLLHYFSTFKFHCYWYLCFFQERSISITIVR